MTTGGAELDALAISHALARIDPGWQKPSGTPRGLVIRRTDQARWCVVTTDRELILAMVTASPGRVLASAAIIHEAIWGDGIAYAMLPATGDSVTLIGRADGRPAIGGTG